MTTRIRPIRRRRPARRRGRRRPARAQRKRGRRGLVVLATVVLGAAGGYAVVNSDSIGDRIREVTLPLKHEDVIIQEAKERDLDPALIAGVIFVESKFQDQESSAGARGLMQITPATAELIEAESGGTTFETDDLSNPDINIAYGSFYLRYLLDRFDGNEVAALAAYNGGETNVAEWGGSDLTPEDIEFPETRAYVDNVVEKQAEYREHYAEELGL